MPHETLPLLPLLARLPLRHRSARGEAGVIAWWQSEDERDDARYDATLTQKSGDCPPHLAAAIRESSAKAEALREERARWVG